MDVFLIFFNLRVLVGLGSSAVANLLHHWNEQQSTDLINASHMKIQI